jgi:Type II restriction endonuclease EcoO109I
VVVPLTAARAAADLAVVLGLSREKAQEVVDAFEEFVARPVELQFRKLKGRQLALRNPMIYTARGTDSTEDWISGVLADKETSAIESHLGTWQEEVARIVSGGTKPANGVDLQVDQGRDVSLYAVQSAPNTKNAAGSKHDLNALKSSAAVLRAQRRHVECFVAVLFGRHKTVAHCREPGIVVLGSDDFWSRVSGVSDFRERLLLSTLVLSRLMKEQSGAELERIRREATVLFDDGTGKLKISALSNPPRRQPRWENGIQLEMTLGST